MEVLKNNSHRSRQDSSGKLMGKGRKNEKGFTLIEMLTTIAIIGIATSVAIPSFNEWLLRYRVNSQANKLYFDLMAAKAQAIRNNSTAIVTFSAANDSYTIHDDLNGNDVVEPGEGVKVVPFENDVVFGMVPGELGVWGTAVSNPIAFNGAVQVKFRSWGQATASGALYLVSGHDLAENFKGRQRAIKIIQATGNIEIMKFDPTAAPGPWS